MFCTYSYAYAFYAASSITGDGLSKIHSLIDDAVAQADEVDEKYLQVTSFLPFSQSVVLISE